MPLVHRFKAYKLVVTGVAAGFRPGWTGVWLAPTILKVRILLWLWLRQSIIPRGSAHGSGIDVLIRLVLKLLKARLIQNRYGNLRLSTAVIGDGQARKNSVRRKCEEE